jgi:hypothetical protein
LMFQSGDINHMGRILRVTIDHIRCAR